MRKETEKMAPDIAGLGQIIIISVITACILLTLFYFLCYYFSPDVAFSFSFGFFPVMYLAVGIAKFIILDFVVRPKLLKGRNKSEKAL